MAGHPRELRKACFILSRPDDTIRSGVHLARRREWPDDRPWAVVYVHVIEDGDGFLMGVWQFGQAEPEPWVDWEIAAPLVGLEKLTRTALNLETVEDATIH